METDHQLPVRYRVLGAVATITLNRPAAMNALDVASKLALLAALRAAAADDAVRAVVLTGEGRGFCVGQDLREHRSGLGTSTPLDTVREHYNPIVRAIVDLPKPVVAAVNGMAAGAGAGLAFACDFRLLSDGGGFLMAFARVGLGPDTGVSWTLQRLVGIGRATALLMTAEPVGPDQALEMGLVNAVVPAHELQAAAQELATKLAMGPTFAYGAIKATLTAAAATGLEESLETEAQWQERCGATEDHRASVEAFVAKQPVTFTGR